MKTDKHVRLDSSIILRPPARRETLSPNAATRLPLLGCSRGASRTGLVLRSRPLLTGCVGARRSKVAVLRLVLLRHHLSHKNLAASVPALAIKAATRDDFEWLSCFTACTLFPHTATHSRCHRQASGSYNHETSRSVSPFHIQIPIQSGTGDS